VLLALMEACGVNGGVNDEEKREEREDVDDALGLGF